MMESTMMVIFVLVLASLTGAALNDLRIGVTQLWRPIVQSALDASNVSMAVELVDIYPGNTRSTFDRIDKTHTAIQRLNVHAVIGPYEPALGLVVESLNIPYLSTTQVTSRGGHRNTFQIMPQMRWSAAAILDIAQTYGWEKISVFYDDDNGVHVLEELMTNHTIVVRAWRLPFKAETRQIRNALVEMRKVLVEKSVVLCSKENTHLLLEEVGGLSGAGGEKCRVVQQREHPPAAGGVLAEKSVVLYSKENTHLLLEEVGGHSGLVAWLVAWLVLVEKSVVLCSKENTHLLLEESSNRQNMDAEVGRAAARGFQS
ncbi:hypothetical protein EGW08_013128 [Elysia chlorotica]|uniref:Receptor ligand binding region domain-containing protein n=1 Tax=Elysia chlorotica TaxID=188477 RepID=A0A3S0ZNL7_ELYCH|nr:hypothetical protein EGW08_013128 [Elysia chlorotica]